MRVKQGDVLVCGTQDCKVELTVTSQCQSNDESCEINAVCCEHPMELKNEFQTGQGQQFQREQR